MIKAEAEDMVDVGAVSLPGHLFDGYLVHRAALAHGLEVLLLPRQVLLAGAGAVVPSKISFTHGVPQSSTLSAVTFAQDRRLRRALFERRGVAKPAGASFSHRSLDRATMWAEEHGFPVSVKEAIGENDGRAVRHVESSEEIATAFTALRIREEADREPGRNPKISGYTTTRLTYVVDDQGRELAPLRTRMLVEQEPKGRAFRVFVVGSEVVAAVELEPGQTRVVKEVTDTTAPDLLRAAEQAADAIPGLGFAMVDLVEVRRPNPFRKPRYVVTELSERPRMAFLAKVHQQLAERVALRLLEYEARNANLELWTPRASVKRNVRVSGLDNPKVVADELGLAYRSRGAKFSMQSVDEYTGALEATCEGLTGTVAGLNELLMSGHLIHDRAAAIEYVNESKVD